jgi:hypothetical protein
MKEPTMRNTVKILDKNFKRRPVFADLKFGELFTYAEPANDGNVYMRVTGDAGAAVFLPTGDVYYISGDKEISRVGAVSINSPVLI